MCSAECFDATVVSTDPVVSAKTKTFSLFVVVRSTCKPSVYNSSGFCETTKMQRASMRSLYKERERINERANKNRRERKAEQGAKKTICQRFLPRARHIIEDIRSCERAILRESRKMNLSRTRSPPCNHGCYRYCRGIGSRRCCLTRSPFLSR